MRDERLLVRKNGWVQGFDAQELDLLLQGVLGGVQSTLGLAMIYLDHLCPGGWMDFVETGRPFVPFPRLLPNSLLALRPRCC